MRICMIGDCGGHISSVFHGTKGPNDYVGVSVASEFEAVDALRRYAAGKGFSIPYFPDWREMLLTVRPDIVAVDTVFSRHAEVTAFALEHGIHVFSEKPAATELSDLEKIRRAWEKSGAVLFSMLTARFDPWFYTARRLIDEGAVGDILMAGGQKSYKLGARPPFFQKRETYGGTIPWVAIHSIDQILWLTGKRCENVFARHSVQGNRVGGELEMTSLISMGLAGDVPAYVHADYCRPAHAPTHGDDRIRVAGTKGVLEVREDKVFLINESDTGEIPVPNQTPVPIFDGFLEVLEGSEDPLYRDCDGLYSTCVALSARESADTGRLISL